MSIPERMTFADFKIYLRNRDIQVAFAFSEDSGKPGEPRKQIGLNLSGPRGTKHFVSINADGTYSTFSTKLWWEGIEYDNQKIQEKRASEGRRRRARGILKEGH